MAMFTKSGVVTIALATGLVVTAGTSGAVAGAMITGKQIKNNTVTTKDIKDRSLRANDLSAAALSALTGAAGPAGPAGPPGEPGAPGAPGAPASLSDGYEIVTAIGEEAGVGNRATTHAICPLGKLAVGGGAEWATGNPGDSPMLTSVPVRILRDGAGVPTGGIALPTDTAADGWRFQGANNSGTNLAIVGYVICVPAQTP